MEELERGQVKSREYGKAAQNRGESFPFRGRFTGTQFHQVIRRNTNTEPLLTARHFYKLMHTATTATNVRH